MIKTEIIKKLKKVGINFDSKSKKEELESLLVEDTTVEDTTPKKQDTKRKNPRLAKRDKNVV